MFSILYEYQTVCEELEEHYGRKYRREDRSNRFQFLDSKLVKALISRYKIKGGSSLLEIGCGTGLYSKLFSQNSLKVVALDFSHEGVKKGSLLHGGKVLWVTGDALHLPFKKEFDTVFLQGLSLFNYSNLEKRKNIAVNLLRFVRPGGYFIFQWSSNMSGVRSQSNWLNYNLEQVRELFNDLPTLAC